MNARHQPLAKRLLYGGVSSIFVFILFVPTIIYAQEVPLETSVVPETTEVLPPEEPETAPYVYNESTGLWENGTYTWDPNTNQSAPMEATSYSYNPDTGAWDSEGWIFDSTSGQYVPNTYTKATIDQTGPDSTNTINNPVSDASISNTGPYSTNQTDGGSINNTGPNSLNSIEHDDDVDLFFNGFYDVSISGNINSTARSGDASVLNNTFGGNATTGNALTQASILNMLQSSWGIGGSPNTYSTTIQGSHVGDLIIDPGGLAVSTNAPSNADLAVVVAEDVSINNDINLLAESGDATVANNTVAGDATSGDALALVTLMNFVNSSISTGQSFIGILNILGDLEGDVLLPDNITGQLLAANVPTTQIQLGDAPSQLDVDIDSSLSIANDIGASASSGIATVDHNTNAGNASSGDASTSVTVFNLTGQQVVAESSLLVFVNVMGEWVGFITNAPTDATSALLSYGGNSYISPFDDVSYDVDRDYEITNNVTAAANSGDATVSNNTFGGDATTGSASTAVNVLNVANSNLSFSNWFGALFINIFGDWHGSFGTDTPFGGIGGDSSPPSTSPPTASSGGSLGSPVQGVVVLAQSSNGQFRRVVSSTVAGTDTEPPAPASVLASDKSTGGSPLLESEIDAGSFNWWIILVTVGGTYGAGRYYLSRQIAV